MADDPTITNAAAGGNRQLHPQGAPEPERKQTPSDWRNQPPEENDSQRDDASQAQTVADEAIQKLRHGRIATEERDDAARPG